MMSMSAPAIHTRRHKRRSRPNRIPFPLVHPIKMLPVLLYSLLISACAMPPISPAETPSSLDPRGPAAAQLADLWWAMFALSMVILVLVTALLILALVVRQRATSQTPVAPDNNQGQSWLIWGGIVLPIIVLGIVFVYTIRAEASVNSQEGEMTIEIVGRRWWWQVIYPDQDLITANELHIPVGVPVRLQLESADVIHSFWVPQLHGKIDLIPGTVNTLTIQADEAGVYRGLCAEYCGVQHAHMGLLVMAQSQEEFDAWLAAQQQPAPAPQDEQAVQGQEVFLGAGCVYCHVIRGLDDSAIDASAVDLGPDLTHFNSRITLAAGTLWNNRGNLAGWISNAQHTKPGSLMPPMFLSSDELHALLAYLETLD